MAALASPSGAGVLLAGSGGMTLDVERIPGSTLLSHLARVPGERGGSEGKGENVDVSSRLKAGSLKSIDGRFSLLPLSAPWPLPLARWFGPPGGAVEVTKRFYWSYDQ